MLSPELGDLRGDVEDLAQELGAEPSFFEAGKWTNHRLARPAWNAATAEDLPVAVVMEWDSSKIKLPAVPPYVGLRITGPAETGGRRRADFLARFSESIGQSSEQYKLGNPATWWPAHRPLPPKVLPWWEHLDEYRKVLRDGLATAWTDLSPLVDEWLQGRPPLRQRK